MTWVDYLIGLLLAIGLLYIFYTLDRRFVYRKEKLGFISHLSKTSFFPRRMVGYLMMWLLILIMVYILIPSFPQGSLTSDLMLAIIRLSMLPFLGLTTLTVIVLFKMAIFNKEELGP